MISSTLPLSLISPIINFNLGICLHIREIKAMNVPCAKTYGGKKVHLSQFHEHPFFALFRKYKIYITLGSDNPGLGGMSLMEVMRVLSGNFGKAKTNFLPIFAEEFAILTLNGINSIFSKNKMRLMKQVIFWIHSSNLNRSFIFSYYT